MKFHTYDVVVIGGGLAGLTVANRCAEFGLCVAVLEAGMETRYFCNSRISSGAINVAFRDVNDDLKSMRQTIDVVTQNHADPVLADVLVNNVRPAVSWLSQHGVRTIVGASMPGARTILAPPAAIGAGLHWQGRGSDITLQRLEKYLSVRRGRLFRGTRARNLIMSGRQCTGVVAEQADCRVTFNASATVIADGGFQADPELLQRYITPHPDRILMRNAGTGRGDGLRMAIDVGAKITDNMDCFYGHVQSLDAVSNPRLWPYPMVDVPVCTGMAVLKNGHRFTDEGLGGVAVANAIAKQADPAGTFAVFDSNIWMERAAAWPLPANPLLPKYNATIHCSNTIEGLAGYAGLSSSALNATISVYNEAVESNHYAGLTPYRSGKLYQPMQIQHPPFFAIPIIAGITYTMGGIAIDGYCRVRHKDEGVITALYAAGSTTGGHEGGPAAGYTGGLSKALTFGWHAGNNICNYVSSATGPV